MPAAPPPVFVLTLEAVAGPANAVPDGRRYSLLVFARGDTDGDAEAAGLKGIADLGWNEPRVLRCGEITDPGAVPPDLVGALENARAHGCAVIVYDEP